jgi:hypothetical protein
MSTRYGTDSVLRRHSSGPVSHVSGYVDQCYMLDAEKIADEYRRVRSSAPVRPSYVVDHDTSQRRIYSNRREELLAYEIFQAGSVLEFPGWRPFTIVDFQTPLNVHRDDGLGKVDLLGSGYGLCVVELKVHRQGSGQDNPLNAVLEAVGYCAVVEHNSETIRNELRDRGHAVERGALSTLVLAPTDYWERWDRTRTPQDWRSGLRSAASVLSAATGLDIGFGSFNVGEIRAAIPVSDVLS